MDFFSAKSSIKNAANVSETENLLSNSPVEHSPKCSTTINHRTSVLAFLSKKSLALCLLIATIFFLCYSVELQIAIKSLDNYWTSIGKISNDLKLSNDCFGENMVYNMTLNDSRTIYGNKFNCSTHWLLERFKLSDKYSLTEKIEVKRPGDAKFVFVAAANAAFFPSLKAMLARTKAAFGCKQRIIAYDLGGVSTNKQMMDDLTSVCNLEWRTFDFTQMSEAVRHLKSFSWKIFVIAQILLEYDTVVWVDSSVYFDSDNLAKFLLPMQNETIGPIQMPSYTSHGINFATHQGTFNYLPLHTNFEPPIKYEATDTTDPPMFEANFIIVHKSEKSRQMMKWAVLCAAESECIVPLGSTIVCRAKDRRKANECHRQDQSVFNVVVANMERQLKANDPSFLAHMDPSHPRNKNNPKRYTEPGINGLFQIRRRQNFRGTKTDFLNFVNCC